MIGGIRVKIAPKTIPVVAQRVDAYGGKTGYTLYGTKCVNLLENFERNGINEMAEKEYIERVSLIKFVKQNTPNIHGDTTMRSVERTLKNAPVAADVVEVVRCKDCKHWGGVTFGYVCREWSGMTFRNYTKPDYYCSRGERKDKDDGR